MTITILLTDDRQLKDKELRRNSGLKCLSTGSHPFPSLSSQFLSPFPQTETLFTGLIIITFRNDFHIFSQAITLITLLPYSYSLIFLILFLPLYVLDKTLMDKVLQVIYPGMIAADFLFHTKRVVQAIVLWKECLTFLNNKHLEKENDLARKVSMLLYNRLCHGYAAIYKLSPAIESGKKLLVLLRKCKRKKEEGDTALMLARLYNQNSEYKKAQEYLQKALTIETEIGAKTGEAICYGELGVLSLTIGKHAKAEEYLRKAIEISKDTRDIEVQFTAHLNLNYCSLALTGNASEALSNLLASIEKCERMLNFLGNNDRYKILFFDQHASPYRLFSLLCSSCGKHYEALHVVELGRARALADLVSDRYFVEKEVSLNPESFAGILKVIKESSNRTCLYISYYGENIFLWTVKQSKPIAFRTTKVCESYVGKHGKISVDDLFKKESLLRNFHVSPQEQCEDRSLFSSYANQLTNEANLEDSLSSFRPLLDEEEVNTDPEPLTLFQVYNMLIAPVNDLLEGSEIIVVPDRCLFQVPFAALHDESNRYLSDTFRTLSLL